MTEHAMSADLLFEPYREQLRAYLARRGLSLPDIEDVEQDVLLGLTEKLRKQEPIDEPRAYIFRIACNVVADRYHDRLPDDAGLAGVPAPECPVESSKLQRAIDALDPLDRALIVLSHREGMQHKEIARELRLSHHTVRKYLKRAEARLKELMDK
jgi:RNA polymerase sigma factor (sigma-70 family)